MIPPTIAEIKRAIIELADEAFNLSDRLYTLAPGLDILQELQDALDVASAMAHKTKEIKLQEAELVGKLQRRAMAVHGEGSLNGLGGPSD